MSRDARADLPTSVLAATAVLAVGAFSNVWRAFDAASPGRLIIVMLTAALGTALLTRQPWAREAALP